MKQCVKFPEDKFLAVRRCLVAICMGNRPAANLLSILLFRYNLRMENKDDAENQNAVKTARGESPDQDTSVRIFRTQAQLVDDMCGEMTEKTLHDTAVPMLQLLGFLDLEEHMIANCYILHVELVQQALNLYIPGKKEQGQLEKFLISTMTPQLEKFRIDLYGLQLEEVLIDKKFFLSGLEKVLIQNRNISNCRRGRKTAPGVARKAKSQLPKNIEEDSKKDIEEERVASPHVDATAPAFSENESHSYRHDHTRKADAWNCHNWCVAHKGKTCADYQAYIDSDAREETPTEPRTPIVTIGAINATHPDTRLPLPDGSDHAHRGGGRPTPGHLGTHRQEIVIGAINATATHLSPDHRVSAGVFAGDTLHAAEPQNTSNPPLAMGAPDGHHTPDHPAADHRATDSVRPDGTGEKEQTTSKSQVQVPPRAVSGNDGAATVRSSGEPAPSGKQLPLSLKESEPTVRPETAVQRKRRIEAREKEIWALVEAGLRTKFTRTHRQLKANTTGMERLIEDETDDETIKTALDRLSDFWKNQFDLSMFHAKLPGLVRKQTRRLADKSPQNVLDAQYEAALQKTGQSLEDEETPAWLDFDNYVGNGPEARQRLVEEGRLLKAQGFCPDL